MAMGAIEDLNGQVREKNLSMQVAGVNNDTMLCNQNQVKELSWVFFTTIQDNIKLVCMYTNAVS